MNPKTNYKTTSSAWVIWGGIGIACIGFLLASYGTFYTVDQGERGVVLRNGQFSSVADPGLHFKIPGIDKVVMISTRTITGKMPKVYAYSRDQQPADITLSITYSVPANGVEKLYTRFGNIKDAYERVIEPIVRQDFKTVFGHYTALSAVQNREQLNHDTETAVKEGLKDYPFLHVSSIQIENIDYSDAYEQTIEDRMKAEVEVERYKQNLERERIEAEIAVTQAQAKADSQVKAAEAQAKSIALRSQAEANAIIAKGKALQDNPNIIELMRTEKWDGKLPSTMLPNSSLPMISLDKQKKQ